MELVLRGAIIYVVLFLLMRASGNRQFSQMTAFDAVLVIMIAEVTGQSLIGEDYSLVGAIVVLATIVGLDLLISVIKQRNSSISRFVDGVPILLVSEGKMLKAVMDKERVEEEDILAAATEFRGLESLDQVKYAVLEPDGKISIVPWETAEWKRKPMTTVEP